MYIFFKEVRCNHQIYTSASDFLARAISWFKNKKPSGNPEGFFKVFF